MTFTRFIRVSIKNFLLRNRHRSFLIGASIAFSITAIIVARSFTESVRSNLETAARRVLLSDVVIVAGTGSGGKPLLPRHVSDFLVTGENTGRIELIPDAGAVRSIVSEMAQVARVRERYKLWGLLSTGERSRPVQIFGLELDNEPMLGSDVRFVEGVRPWPGKSDPPGIAIWEDTAARLKVGLKDELILLGITPDGYMNATSVTLGGLFRVRSIDFFMNTALFLSLDSVRRLAGVDDSATQVIMVDLARGVSVEEGARLIREELLAKGYDVQVFTWMEVAGPVMGIIKVNQLIPGIMTGILFVVLAIGLANVLYMAVQERTREIGTIMALGFNRRQVMHYFLCESLVVGVSGTLIGTLLGVGIIFIAQRVGIPVGKSFGLVIGSDYLYLPLSLGNVMTTSFGMMLWSIVVGLLPARRAAHLVPVEALRAT
ncbi:MAG: FtsX-like permease family protein [bacterium]